MSTNIAIDYVFMSRTLFSFKNADREMKHLSTVSHLAHAPLYTMFTAKTQFDHRLHAIYPDHSS